MIQKQLLCGLFAGWFSCSLVAAADGDLHQRRFRLTYSVTITALAPLQRASAWMPVPPNNGQQRVHAVAQKLPGPSQLGREAKYGNDILYFEAAADAAGKISAGTTYEVVRSEARGATSTMMSDDPLAVLFLKPDA